MSALQFARTYLFAPLGIQDAIWPADPQGVTHGWGDLHLRPDDFAKLGYLYLQGGRWSDRQVVSESWVKQSVAPHVTVRDGVGYGYSWWVNTARQPFIFEAVGRGGQRAAVLPDKDWWWSLPAAAPTPTSSRRFSSRLSSRTGRSGGPARRPSSADAAHRSATAACAVSIHTNECTVPCSSARDLRPPICHRRESTEPDAPVACVLGADRGSCHAAAVRRRIPPPDRTRWPISLLLDGTSGPADGSQGALGVRQRAVLDLDTVANINHFTIRVAFQDEQVTLRVDEATGEVNDLVVGGRVDSKK